jgi:hypothetical protein
MHTWNRRDKFSDDVNRSEPADQPPITATAWDDEFRFSAYRRHQAAEPAQGRSAQPEAVPALAPWNDDRCSY